MTFTRDMETIPGLEESQIIRAISEFFGEVESIHYVTSIPITCIEYKVAALKGIGWVRQSEADLVLSEENHHETNR